MISRANRTNKPCSQTLFLRTKRKRESGELAEPSKSKPVPLTIHTSLPHATALSQKPREGKTKGGSSRRNFQVDKPEVTEKELPCSGAFPPTGMMSGVYRESFCELSMQGFDDANIVDGTLTCQLLRRAVLESLSHTASTNYFKSKQKNLWHGSNDEEDLLVEEKKVYGSL